MSQILDVNGLSGRYTLRSYTYATYFDVDGNLLEINTEGAAQVPEGYENAGRVVQTPIPRRIAISPMAALRWWRVAPSLPKPAIRC